jgi:hypothetical protein
MTASQARTETFHPYLDPLIQENRAYAQFSEKTESLASASRAAGNRL